MKKLLLILPVAAVLLLGVNLVKQRREAREARVREAAAAEQAKAVAAAASKQEKRTKELQTKLRESRTDAAERAAETQALKQRLAATDEKIKAHKGPAEMLRDPQMREAMKQQARAAVERGVQSLFDAGLVEQLQLNDEQAASLKMLLAQKQTIWWEEVLMPMMTGELDDAGLAAMGRSAKEALDATTAQLGALLGDAGQRTLEWFEKTQPERDRLAQVRGQLAKAGQPLDAAQERGLLGAMVEEHAGFRFTHDFGDPAQFDFADLHGNFTDDKLTNHFQEMGQLDERILTRAMAVLSPEQLALFKQALERQRLQSQFTARMTTVAFGKKR